MVPGLGLIAANFSVTGQPLTDQNELWVRLGVFLIGLGFVGLIVELVLVIGGLGRRLPAPDSAGAVAANTVAVEPESPEVKAKLEELDRLRAEDRRQRRQAKVRELGPLIDRMNGFRRELREPRYQAGDKDSVATFTSIMESYDQDARELLAEPDLVAEYDHWIDPVKVDGAKNDADRAELILMVKVTRLGRIQARLRDTKD